MRDLKAGDVLKKSGEYIQRVVQVLGVGEDQLVFTVHISGDDDVLSCRRKSRLEYNGWMLVEE